MQQVYENGAVILSDFERSLFRLARHGQALNFYIALRRDLSHEYATGRPFFLPANMLAKQQFLQGRRDRKVYMRLIWELVRLGLVCRIRTSHFDDLGKRQPALYVFPTSVRKTANVILLAARQNGGC